MNIFVPFSICPYDAFNICKEDNNVRSWIIEHLFMHDEDDAHAKNFLVVFLTPNIKICITWSFLELFFMIQAPLDAQL
jgi:hypothetical protein